MDTAGEVFRDGFAGSLGAQWDWGDAFEDCSATQDGGPTIRARHGCDLRRLNRSAPRVLRAVPGDFAAQTVCSAVSDMTLKVGHGPSGGFLSDLKSWISDGAPND